jgi:hypothetical protein
MISPSNLGGFSDQTLNEARELPIGSTLISPPVAVASGSHVHVFGIGPDHGLYHWVYNSAAQFGSRWSPQELVGVNFWSTPAPVLTGPNQIDLFGLGPDRGMLHTRWNGSKWSDWEELAHVREERMFCSGAWPISHWSISHTYSFGCAAIFSSGPGLIASYDWP